MRTVLHFTPAVGWLNDPNGLVEHRGVHHLFFQHNPHELAIRDMCWGHASSTDLLAWTEHPVALAPGPRGSYDGDGCWSGCAVHDGDEVAIIYSGHNAGIQLPCLARPLDEGLIAWEKAAENPVVGVRPPIPDITDMRDHSVRWDGSRWHQVLAGGAGGEGMLFGYSSSDLVNWAWEGLVLRAGDAGLPGQVWECPDVFEAGDHIVAIISVVDGDHRPVIWVTGVVEGTQLHPQRWGLLDYGDRLYAPQSYTDHIGRRLMFGWLRTQLDPGALGQPNLGVASLPRVLSVVDGRLHQEPAGEIRERRGEADKFTLGPDEESLSVPLPRTPALELQVERQAGDDLVGLRVEFGDHADHRMVVDLTIFSSSERPPGHDHPAADRRQPHTATVIFDCGIVEIFLDDGRAAALSDARLEDVSEVHVTGAGGGPVGVTVWALGPSRSN